VYFTIYYDQSQHIERDDGQYTERRAQKEEHKKKSTKRRAQKKRKEHTKVYLFQMFIECFQSNRK